VSDSLDLSRVDLSTGMVAADVPCVVCQYNLRTISLGAHCPECGTAVTASLRRGELHHADVGWLRITRNGLALLAGAFAVSVVGELFQLMAPRFLDPSAPLRWWFMDLILVNGSNVLTCIACFAITHPEPTKTAGRSMGRNKLLRMLVVGLLILSIIGWAFPFVQFAWVNGWVRLLRAGLEEILTPTSPYWVQFVLWIALTVAVIGTLLLLALHLRRLAMRAGRRTVRKILTLVVGLLAIDALVRVALLLAYAGFVATGGLPAWYDSAYHAERITDAAASVIVLIVSLRLMQLFGRAVAGREA
jgi:hypothetical protein